MTEQLNNIFDRYAHLVRACALPLDDEETQVLLNVLNGSVVEPAFIEYLAQESGTRITIWRVSPRLNHCMKSACQRPIHNCWPPSSGSIAEEGKTVE